MKTTLKIGTRASPMALVQTDGFIAALQARHPHLKAPGAVEVVKITTTGDRVQDRALAEIGGKALFTKEIETALLEGAIDCAVHSMKDMQTFLPEGLCVPCLLPRDDPRDAFLSPKAAAPQDLPHGAVVGTSSPRRQAILLALRPDLKIIPFRGNAGTRIRKLQEGAADATLLAIAGLRRIGMEGAAACVLEPAVMLPAAAQGAVGIETRERDEAVKALISAVHCPVTALRIAAERAYLAAMEGDCQTPLAALMEAPDPEGRARLDVLAADPDGGNLQRLSFVMHVAHTGDAERLGAHAGAEMKAARRKRA